MFVNRYSISFAPARGTTRKWPRAYFQGLAQAEECTFESMAAVVENGCNSCQVLSRKSKNSFVGLLRFQEVVVDSEGESRDCKFRSAIAGANRRPLSEQGHCREGDKDVNREVGLAECVTLKNGAIFGTGTDKISGAALNFDLRLPCSKPSCSTASGLGSRQF